MSAVGTSYQTRTFTNTNGLTVYLRHYMARGERPLQDFIRVHRLAIRLGAAVAIVLLGVAGWRTIAATQPRPTTTGQSGSSTVAACTYPDATFCRTEAHYRTLVATQAVSDILESQTVTPHACSGQDEGDRYCAGTSSGLTIPLYNIAADGQAQLFTRNGGIAYLRSFFADNGTPTYQATTPDSASNAIVMIFTSRTEVHLLLHFTRVNSSWQFTYPEIATTTP